MNRKHVALLALAICAFLLSGYPSVYSLGYIVRVMVKQDPNTDDYRSKHSRPIPAADHPRQWRFQLAETRVSAAFESHERVDSLVSYLERTGTKALVVVSGDTIVYEKYLRDSGPETPQATFSVSKSILSILLGSALENGTIESLDHPVTRYLPELLTRDAEFAGISLAHLIDMRSGIAYSRKVTFPFVNSDPPLIYYASDLPRVVLTKTHIQQPPGTFLYNDYNPNLLALALDRATGGNTLDNLHPVLWQVIGAAHPALWSTDDNGFPYWESGLVATPRDLARVGLMMLNQGMVDDVQVISEDWHRRSTSYELDEPLENYNGRQWAYRNGWWKILRPEAPHDYAAIGHYGQFIYVSPRNHVVIVRLGHEDGAPSDTESTSIYYWVADRLNDR